jgi:acyl-ACP thioesterase
MLLYIQQIAGEHSDSFSLTYDALAQRGIFWAVIRHKIEISRMPMENETITLETWPMPTTRVAYPRSTVAYDEQGNVLFRSVCLWILMDLKDRSMLVPKKSGVEVNGFLRGDELPTPKSLLPHDLRNSISRTVVFSDLDRNGHMNNARYLDWVQDLLSSEHHREHSVKELTMCYINEALENQKLDLTWEYDEENTLHVDIHRNKDSDDADYDRIFSTKIKYE